MFMFAQMQELMSCYHCPSLYVFIGRFDVEFGVAIVKTFTRKKNAGNQTEFAWKIEQAIDHTNTECTVIQFCTWHAIGAIKKTY